MKNFLQEKIKSGFNRLGLQISKIKHVPWGWIGEKPSGASLRLYFGPNEDVESGYVICDKVPNSGVRLVCRPWEIHCFTNDADAILCRHILEYLTDEEARVTLTNWYKALRVNGTIEIVVPDITLHINEWLKANWSEEGSPEEKSLARNAFYGIYGLQCGSDPKKPDYNQTYKDVRKSGYDVARLEYLLETNGFARIQIETSNEGYLIARASKITQKKERQVAPKLQGVRADHRARYILATRFVGDNFAVADIACGIGYGSFILAQVERISSIFAMDIDPGAIEYAHSYYEHQKIEYREGDVTQVPLVPASFDMVMSFETIEHIQEYQKVLAIFFAALKPGGLLLCSSPNEEVIPLETMNNPYHFRHFTPAEFETCLQEAGFQVLERYTQTDRESDQMESGWHGIYNTAVCKKPVN